MLSRPYNGESVAYSIADKQDASLVLDTLDPLPKRTSMLLQGSIGFCLVMQASPSNHAFYLISVRQIEGMASGFLQSA